MGDDSDGHDEGEEVKLKDKREESYALKSG